ncbi:MAG: hypothetical protein K2X29_11195 [Candidatus Obscuribacterales bacterium]|nr:hypothetical protein [Candidatus Obscuribacterales bacterium]
MPENSYIQPAQQTALGKEGSGLQPRIWTPERGLYLRTSLPMMPDDGFTVAKNVRWNGITWTTQKMGWREVRSAPFGDGAILEMAIHFDTNGDSHYVHQAGSKVQTYDPIFGGSETVLFTAASATAIPCMRSFAPNFFIYVNGVDEPQSWDGLAGSFSPLSVWVGGFTNGSVTYTNPKICEPYNNRVAYANFPQDPYAIILSDFGNPDSITIPNPSNDPTFGGIFFVPSQLGPVRSLKYLQVSLTDNEQVLLVGCENGFAIITGVSATDFKMVAIQSGKWGILSNRNWFVIDNTAYCLCTDGIRPFNGNAYQTNLVSAALSFPVHPIITAMSRSAAASSQAFVLDNPAELEATFYFSSGADIRNRTALIMNYSDYNSGIIRFSTKLFPTTLNTFLSPSCGIEYKGNFYCGGYDGKLQKVYQGNTFNGIGIDYQLGSPIFAPPTPSQEASPRGYWIMQQGTTTRFKAKCYSHLTKADPSQSLKRSLTGEQELSFNTDGETILGAWVLGESPFGGPQYNITPFYPDGGGKGQEIEISGNTANGDINLIGIFSTLIGGGTRQ